MSTDGPITNLRALANDGWPTGELELSRDGGKSYEKVPWIDERSSPNYSELSRNAGSILEVVDDPPPNWSAEDGEVVYATKGHHASVPTEPITAKASKRLLFPLMEVLAVVFVTLKLCGVIGWSWWWVLLTVWVPITFCICATFALVCAEVIDAARLRPPK